MRVRLLVLLRQKFTSKSFASQHKNYEKVTDLFYIIWRLTLLRFTSLLKVTRLKQTIIKTISALFLVFLKVLGPFKHGSNSHYTVHKIKKHYLASRFIVKNDF